MNDRRAAIYLQIPAAYCRFSADSDGPITVRRSSSWTGPKPARRSPSPPRSLSSSRDC